VPADLGGDEVEGVVGDAGVDVDAAIVPERLHVVVHVRRLGILAEHRIVVRGPRRLHRPERDAVDVRCEEASADQPVGLRRGLVEGALLHEGAEHVRDRLVQRAGLEEIDEGLATGR